MLVCGAPLGAYAVDFSGRDELAESVSEDGTVTLSWVESENLEVILQQSSSADFTKATTRYQGTDPASVLTGLPEGTHYFRIADAATMSWSAPLAVTVQFFPRWKLWLILLIGSGVVLATILTIVAGHFTSQKLEPES